MKVRTLLKNYVFDDSKLLINVHLITKSKIWKNELGSSTINVLNWVIHFIWVLKSFVSNFFVQDSPSAELKSFSKA